MVPQASVQETPHETHAPPTPPKASLASMTITDQDLYDADGQTLDRMSGGSASAITSVHGSLDRGQNQGRPLNSVFFMDGVGSRTIPNKTLTPPKMPHSLSPSRSDTSEEVIVFAGRNKAPQNSLQNQRLSGYRPSYCSDQQRPTNHEKLHQNKSATACSPPANLATPYGLRRSTDSIESTSKPFHSKVDLEEPATDNLIDFVRLPRKERRNQRQSKKKARLRAEEDDILADYIEHMHSEENLDEAFRNLAHDDSPRRDPLTDRKSEVNVDGNTEEIATAQSSAESTIRDLNITQGYHDSDLGPFTELDSDHSIDDAQIAADVQEHMDDIEDERDLLERRQAMMTDEQIARLLAKQEELGLSSSELLLFDGNGAGDDEEVLPSEDEDDALFSRFSAATKTSRRAKHSNQYQSPGASSLAILAADSLNRDPYGELDVMDHASPCLKRTPKGRRSAPAFELSDAELDAQLLLAWEKDRSKKKIRKKEREELRAQGLLAGPNQTDLQAKYREGVSFSEVKLELTEFMGSTRQR